MSYKLVEDGIRRLSDRAYIPLDNDNIDYQKYLEWVAEGNTPEPQYTHLKNWQAMKQELMSINFIKGTVDEKTLFTNRFIKR